eukprot:1003961-Prymnesium_polylepis.1
MGGRALRAAHALRTRCAGTLFSPRHPLPVSSPSAASARHTRGRDPDRASQSRKSVKLHLMTSSRRVVACSSALD